MNLLMEQARAVMRRGKWNRLNAAIDLVKASGDDPKTGQYAQALASLDALEVEMDRAGQTP